MLWIGTEILSILAIFSLFGFLTFSKVNVSGNALREATPEEYRQRFFRSLIQMKLLFGSSTLVFLADIPLAWLVPRLALVVATLPFVAYGIVIAANRNPPRDQPTK